MADLNNKSIYTRAVHAGDRNDAPVATPVATPIYTAASFYYDEVETIDHIFAGNQHGYAYTRYDNPTVNALEQLVTSLEGGFASLATSSGMAATHIAMVHALQGRERRILAAEAIYGATIRLLDHVIAPTGVAVEYTDIFHLETLEAHITRFQPALLFIESISNPLLRVPEIDKIADLCKRHNVLLMVDNTFATPLLVRPIELGADYSIHSLTKFLAGHGDVIGGIVTTTEPHWPTLKQLSKTLGALLGPFEAYLTMRGIKTFALRVERQCRNARAVADALAQHPGFGRVYHPGRTDHIDHATAARLMPNGIESALVAFEIKGATREQMFRYIDNLKMVVPATSLGDVHSLMLYPVMASHRDVPPDTRQKLGITDQLLRLSCGIESADDIIADLLQALN